MADVWYKTGQFITPASGTTVINTTDKGTNSKAIHIWWSRVTADDTIQAHQAFGHGLSDGTTHRAFNTNAQDGASNTRRNNLNTGWILMEDPTDDTADVQGTSAAMNANDVTLSYTTFTSGYRIHYEIWGGTDCTASVDEMAVSASPFTGNSFTADLLCIINTGNAITNASQHAFMSCGYAHDNGASIDQWCLYTYMGDNDEDFIGSSLVPGDIAGQYNEDYANWTAQITAIGATGFTWTGTNADEWAALSLEFSGAGVDIGSFTKSTGGAPVTQALPDLGFTPMGYMLASADRTTTTITGDIVCHASMGAYDGNTQTSALAVGTIQSNADRASQSRTNEVLQGSSALQATGIEWSGTAQTITDSTPDIEWNPNTSNAVHIGYHAIAQQVAPPVEDSITFSLDTDYSLINALIAPKSITFDLDVTKSIINDKLTLASIIFNIQLQELVSNSKTVTGADAFNILLDQNQNNVRVAVEAVSFLADLNYLIQNQVDGIGNHNFMLQMNYLVSNIMTSAKSVSFNTELSKLLSNYKTVTSSEIFDIILDQDQSGLVSITATVAFLLNLNYQTQNQLTSVATEVFNIQMNKIISNLRSTFNSSNFNVQLAEILSNLKIVPTSEVFNIILSQNESVQIDFTALVNFAALLTANFIGGSIGEIEGSISYALNLQQVGTRTANILSSISYNSLLDIQESGTRDLLDSVQISLQQDMQTEIHMTIQGQVALTSQMLQSTTLQLLKQTDITFGHLLGLASFVSASRGGSVSFGTIQDISVVGNVFILTLTTPDDRVLKIYIEDRTISIDKENRSLIVDDF